MKYDPRDNPIINVATYAHQGYDKAKFQLFQYMHTNQMFAPVYAYVLFDQYT